MPLDPKAIDLRSIDPRAQLLDLDRADSEESLYTFFRAAWPYIDPAPWMDGWCMEAIADHLQAVCDGDIKRLLINISPRCSKSSLVSVAFPAWVWAQPRVGPISGPTVPFLHASYANQLSLRDSVKCRRLIESPWYQERWGNRFQLTSDQNTKSRFTNDKGGERLITSIDGTNTGEGGMCFIAGTLVSTPSGDRRIEEMKVGDPVFAFDVQRGKVVISKVLATSRRKTNDLCTLHEVSGHRFTCTSNHPIYSPGRRFIKAGELGQGDRLLIAGEKRATDTDDSAFDLRKLWEENTKTPISATQGAHAEQQRRLLRQCVQVAAPRIQKFHKYLSHVFQAVIKSAWAVLFDGLQADRKRTSHNGAASHAPGETLRILQKRISAAEQESFLLLCQMLQRSAFSANDWIWKFQVSREWGLFESLHGDALGGERERPQSLRDLPRERENLHQAQEEDLIGGASHRRKTEKQCAAELDYVVRAVPSQSPLWHFGRVAEVQCHRDQEVEVYDIQVEGQNNFFAESILVHNCIIIDDPNSVDDVDSEATIQTAIDWWEGTMPTRLNNQETGAYIIIQQRTFENDLTGHILETEGADWVHLMIPMRYEPDRSFFSPIGWKDPRTVEGELMWPERFSEAATKRLEKRLGSFRTAGQLQQRPEPAGGGIIRRAWWQLWEGESFPPFDFIVGLLDTAFTELEMNDPSGMMVLGVFSGEASALLNPAITSKLDRDGNRIEAYRMPATEHSKIMLVNAWDDRLTLHELVKRVEKTCRMLKVDLLLIENKASGISVAQEIRRLFSNEKFGVQLVDPKSQDKMARLISIQHLFEEGLVYAPSESYPWVERVIAQVGQFPKGKHDEFVDLISMGLRYLRGNGLISRAPEKEAEIEAQKAYRPREQPLYPA